MWNSCERANREGVRRRWVPEMLLAKQTGREAGVSGVRRGRRGASGRESLPAASRPEGHGGRDTGVEPPGTCWLVSAYFPRGIQIETRRASSDPLPEQVFCPHLSGRSKGGSEVLSESCVFINNLQPISPKRQLRGGKIWVPFNIEFKKCPNCNFSLSSGIKCEFRCHQY